MQGAINFCPHAVPSSASGLEYNLALNVAIHELVHALGVCLSR
jgi:hypothetical protein